ncbi:hypothetical protein OB920_18165 [Halobacteria archaeon HArc-gm2]|nr:hypothetical protein [Halobacteria archaeon HArc-gm2]
MEPPERWRSFLVSAAPLAGNTGAALAALYGVRVVVRRPGMEGTVAGSDVPLALLAERFVAAGLPRQSLAALCLWVGTALAYTGFPSSGDLRAVSKQLALIAGRAADRSASIGYYAEYAHGELSTIYTVVVTIAGLVGVRAVFEFGDLYVLVVLSGTTLFVLSNYDGTNGLTANPVRARMAHAEQIEERAAAGELIPRNEVDALVDLLAHESDAVRNRAGRGLRAVAVEQPSMVAEWEERLFEVLRTEERVACRTPLLNTLVYLRAAIEDTDRLAAVGVDTLTADDSRLRDKGAGIVAAAAEVDPALVVDAVDELVEVLPTLSDGPRANAALALALIAEADASHVEPYRERITSYRDDEYEKVRDRIQRIDDAIESTEGGDDSMTE